MPRRRLAVTALTLALGFVLAGCDALRGSAPSPTPGDFGALAVELAARGVSVSNVVSGDPGCNDPSLAPTAISFSATGLDQPAPIKIRVYLFVDDAAYQRRRADVDACAAGWASDLPTFEFVDASPFVLAGQGPWGPNFKTALQAAIRNAAGD